MKKLINYLAILLLLTGLSLATGCDQLGLTDSDEDDNNFTGLLLLLGLANNNNNAGAQRSGFFVTIPNGVAK